MTLQPGQVEAASDRIIDDGEGGKLLEITQSSTIVKAALVEQKAAIATWRAEENVRHEARLADLTAREMIIDKRIALFS